jgi:hypothetical protein
MIGLINKSSCHLPEADYDRQHQSIMWLPALTSDDSRANSVRAYALRQINPRYPFHAYFTSIFGCSLAIFFSYSFSSSFQRWQSLSVIKHDDLYPRSKSMKYHLITGRNAAVQSAKGGNCMGLSAHSHSPHLHTRIIMSLSTNWMQK